MRRLAPLVALGLALVACGKAGPPVAPERRLPQPVTDLRGVIENGGIELSWTNPTRRADNTRLRDLAAARVFRAEDAGPGEPKPALLSRGRIVGYMEVATIRLGGPPPADAPAPAVVLGHAIRLTDRQGLTPGRRYSYVVVTEDGQGRVSPPSPRVTLTLIAPPEPPARLAAVAGEREVRLRWEAPARLVDGTPPPGPLAYEVLRAADATTPPEVVTPAPIEATQLTDRNLENERPYYYAVRAIRREGETIARSRPTERVSASPVKMTPPAPPSDLVAAPAGNTVRLSWRPSPDPDAATYVVYRAAGSGPFQRVGSTRAPSTVFVDRDVTSGTYRYVVTAQDASSRANESPRSNEARVTLP